MRRGLLDQRLCLQRQLIPSAVRVASAAIDVTPLATALAGSGVEWQNGRGRRVLRVRPAGLGGRSRPPALPRSRLEDAIPSMTPLGVSSPWNPRARDGSVRIISSTRPVAAEDGRLPARMVAKPSANLGTQVSCGLIRVPLLIGVSAFEQQPQVNRHSVPARSADVAVVCLASAPADASHSYPRLRDHGINARAVRRSVRSMPSATTSVPRTTVPSRLVLDSLSGSRLVS